MNVERHPVRSLANLALVVFFAVYFIVAIINGVFSSKDVWSILEALAAIVAAVALAIGY